MRNRILFYAAFLLILAYAVLVSAAMIIAFGVIAGNILALVGVPIMVTPLYYLGEYYDIVGRVSDSRP